MPKIDFMRGEVKRQLNKWTQIRDCIAGAETIKSKGTKYLPMPNAHDKSAENKARYRGYVQRAMFMNAVSNTIEGLVGQVFSADPVVDLPPEMELLLEDCDGNGMTLTQRAKKVLFDVLSFGRLGLLVDFPEPMAGENGMERDFTRAEMQDGTARANILQFDPADVINWRTRLVGGKTLLSLVVIEMQYILRDDGFEIEEANEWRVLKLDETDQYVVEIWRKNPETTSTNVAPEPFVLYKKYFPRDSTGARLKFIPFTFVGSLNNNESPDKPPMYDISEINLGHYRNSADYEDSIYMVGQGTPVATGLTAGWVKDVWKDKPLQLGSRGVIPLPAGGDFKIVAADENGMVKEGMDQKENQLAMLGAQLVMQQEVQRTLGEAQIERAVIESTLVQCAKNDGAAVQQCLKWAALFYGVDDGAISFELSTDFAITKLSPEERKQLIMEWQSGAITFEEMRNGLRQSGIAYLEDTVAKTKIEGEQEAAIDLAMRTAAAENGGENGSGSDE